MVGRAHRPEAPAPRPPARRDRPWRVAILIGLAVAALLLVPFPVPMERDVVSLPCGYLAGFGTGSAAVGIPGPSYVTIDWRVATGSPVVFAFTGPGIAYRSNDSTAGHLEFSTAGGDFSLWVRSQDCSAQPLVRLSGLVFTPMVGRLPVL